ncbi:MAG: hypothetical protein M3Z37_10670 [Candidatus Eremiobacteraeota bacterium]|nr:hypothetical protein [Candidatus Eremiobacteraeota bacterium]
MLALATLLFIALPAAAFAEASQWQTSPSGRTIFVRFPEAPYPYSSRASGHVYEKKQYDVPSHYSDSTVAIFIPAGYVPTGGVDFIVHFHGWRNHVARALDYYQMREQVADSRVNAVLVVPQGPYDAPDSDFGRLEHEPGAFAALLNHITAFLMQQHVLTSTSIKKITLSAHSGGYGGLSGVLALGGLPDSVTDVLLFDAAYGKLDGFSNWLAGARQRRLVTLFTDDTISGNVELLSMLQKRSVTNRVLMQADLTPEALQLRGATFIYTPDLPHDETMQKLHYYELFLRTADLPTNAQLSP